MRKCENVKMTLCLCAFVCNISPQLQRDIFTQRHKDAKDKKIKKEKELN